MYLVAKISSPRSDPLSVAKMSFDYDYAVVGAGINGTFAALHLADRAHRTVLIDQVGELTLLP